jgi:hypothetical protein
MNEQNLFAYLNDHLAGSVGALELLDHMRESAQEDDFRLFCSALYAEIESDQMVLKDVISKLGASEGTIKKVGAWLMEKGSWTEMMLAGLNKDDFGRLQALEGLALGITGKKGLWTALGTIKHLSPTLQSLAIPDLVKRAEEQIAQVDKRRLKVAEAAFSIT